MIENEKTQRIQRMKQALQDHFLRFKALRKEGRHEEALRQFNVTLKAASELMETSTLLLKDIADRHSELAEPELPGGKLLHFPKSRHNH